MIDKLMIVLKKSYFIILIFVLFLMLGLKTEDTSIHDTTKMQEIQYVTVGDSIDYGINQLRELYDFNGVEIYEESYVLTGNSQASIDMITISIMESNQYFYMNHRAEITAIKQGVAKLKIHLLKDEKIEKRIDLGLYAITNDISIDDTWIGLNGSNFNQVIESNPDGKYYLEDDITDVSLNVDYFSGTLLNPYQYTITLNSMVNYDVNGGIFKTLDGAYINGLMIKNSNMTISGLNRVEAVSVGYLAAYSGNSIIENVSVEGNITCDQTGSSNVVGGIVGVSYGTIYRHISFIGDIEGDFERIGGLIGIAKFNYTYSNFITGLGGNNYDMIDGAIVISNILSSNNSWFNNFHAFIGSFFDQDSRIEHGYFDGSIQDTSPYDGFPFFYNSNVDKPKISYLYTTLGQADNEENRYTFETSELMVLTPEELKSGDFLPGLSMFTFEEGEYPELSPWRLP